MATNMRALRKAIDQVRTGIAPAGPFVVVGDSTDRGPSGSHAQSWPTQMAAMLNAAGIPTSTDSVCGASNITTTAAFMTADPRVVLGAGWSVNTGIRSAGGHCFEFPANTAPAALEFTPSAPFNQVDVYYYRNAGAGLGPFTVDRGGVAPTAGSPVDSNLAPQAIAKVTLNWGTTSLAALNINAPSAASPKFRIVAIVCRDTASPKLEIINAAWAGSCSQDWISGPGVQAGLWGPMAAISAMAPICIAWGHKINDFNPGTTSGTNIAPIRLEAYTANTAMYAGLVPGASFITLRKAQSDPSAFASIATQDSYAAVDAALAAIPGTWLTADFQAVCGAYAQAQADGLNLDQRHYNALGNQRGARQVAQAILSL